MLIYRIIRNFSDERLLTIIGKFWQKFCLFYSLNTQGVLQDLFSFIRTLISPNEKYYSSYLNIQMNGKFSIENLIFFYQQAIQIVLFVLHATYTNNTPYWAGLDLDNSLAQSYIFYFKTSWSY